MMKMKMKNFRNVVAVLLVLTICFAMVSQNVAAKDNKSNTRSTKQGESVPPEKPSENPPQFDPQLPESDQEKDSASETISEPADQPGPTSIVEGHFSRLRYGSEVTVEPGTVYYETAAFGGSGKTGIVGNDYTQGKLRICGFGVLNKQGQVERSSCYGRETIPDSEPQPEFFSQALIDRAWVAVVTDGFTTGDIGWLRRSDVELEVPLSELPIVGDMAAIAEECQNYSENPDPSDDPSNRNQTSEQEKDRPTDERPDSYDSEQIVDGPTKDQVNVGNAPIGGGRNRQ